MKRLLAVFFVIGGMALVGPAAPAFGRGDGWQPAPFTPFDASCGEITVHVTAPVNKEYFKETVLEDGTVQDTITGSFRLNYTTDFGKSVTVNSSGPGDLLFRQSGDLEIVAQGLDSFAFTAEQAE